MIILKFWQYVIENGPGGQVLSIHWKAGINSLTDNITTAEDTEYKNKS